MRYEFTKLHRLLRDAEKEAERIEMSTTCPDPAEGGCIGGPIPGLGCVNEASRYVARQLRDLAKKIASEQ